MSKVSCNAAGKRCKLLSASDACSATTVAKWRTFANGVGVNSNVWTWKYLQNNRK